MTIEQGRSPRTIDAYRRDNAVYEKFLITQDCDVLTSSSEVVERYIASLR